MASWLLAAPGAALEQRRVSAPMTPRFPRYGGCDRSIYEHTDEMGLVAFDRLWPIAPGSFRSKADNSYK